MKTAYAPLIPRLRKPNLLEPRGQGLWVVPGIFWGMSSCRHAISMIPARAHHTLSVPCLCVYVVSCSDRGGAGTAGTDGIAACRFGRCIQPSSSHYLLRQMTPWHVHSNASWCSNGTQCMTSPSWLVGKMRLYWEWAKQERAIRGINPWHWQDVPVLSPPSLSRGAVSLGSQLKQWLEWIGHNISSKELRATHHVKDT
eukprot:SAG31_NODE_3574_length_4113_cov_2.614848_4_plen_198_part_00